MGEATSGKTGTPPAGTLRVVAAVIRRNGEYLLTKRAEKAVLPGYWEFPGGKVESGESDEQALVREVRERVCLDVKVGKPLARRRHDYGDYVVELTIYEASIEAGEPCKGNVADFAWVPGDQLESYEFPPADRQTTAELLGLTGEDR